jgi:hypothetical protein
MIVGKCLVNALKRIYSLLQGVLLNHYLKNQPLPPTTPEEIRKSRDAYILYKVRRDDWDVRQASQANEEFSQSLKQFRSHEIEKDKFLPIARKYVPHPYELKD